MIKYLFVFGILLICVMLFKIYWSLNNINRNIEKQTGWISLTNKYICDMQETIKSTDNHSGKIEDRLYTAYPFGVIKDRVDNIKDEIVRIKDEVVELKDEVGGLKNELQNIDVSIGVLKDEVVESIGVLKDEVVEIKDKLPDID